MFQKKVKSDGSVSISDLSNRILSFSMDKHPKAGVTRYLNKRSGFPDEHMVYGRGSLTTHSVSIQSKERDRAVSFVFGVPMGVDGTAQILPKTFVTGSVSTNFRLHANGQLILQRQLADGNPVGWSLGLMLIRNNVGYDTEARDGDVCCTFGPTDHISTISLGPRTAFLINIAHRYKKPGHEFLYANAAYLYDTTLKVWYPKVGFSIGFY